MTGLLKGICSATAPIALALAVGTVALPAAAQECEIKIGAAGPMSGGSAAWGLAMKSGAEFLAALAAEQGGLQVGDKKCSVKVVPFDSQYTAAGGAAAANFFASESVHAVIGPVGAPEVTGFKPVAKRNDQVSFNTTYAKDAIGPDFPLAFHQLQTPVTWGPILIREAKKRFGFKTAVLVGANDQGGTDGTRALAAMYKKEGVEATEEYYQRGTSNFAPIATRIMNVKPDLVDIATMPPGDQAIIVKQLLEAGFEGTIGSLGGGGEKPLVEGAGGGKNLKGAYWLNVVATESPNMPKLVEDFKRVMKTDVPVNGNFFTATTAAEMVLKAISAAGTDKSGEKIAEALRNMKPVSRYFGDGGWRGKTQFGINQELAFPVGLGIYQDGKRVGVETIQIPAED
jgi:branched-chain amino acid transport system substrate-binding protein